MEEIKMKPVVLRGSFSVKQKTYLAPHYIRVIFTGDDIDQFRKVTVGVNNKIFLLDKNQAAIRRTYTLRSLNLETKEMAVDFVAHGEEGPASAWAIHAAAGDVVEIGMKDKQEPLYPKADWYLLAGDHTALPVISVILETLPAIAEGAAFIHVGSATDMLDIDSPSKVKINWIIGDHLQSPNLLQKAVQGVTIPENQSKYVFLAAEAEVVKDLRNYFKEKDLQREEFSAFAYWKYGVSEGG